MSRNKLDLFYTLKLNTSYIVQNNYNVVLDFATAKKNNQIIALGDNQLLNFIRRITRINYNKEEIQELIKKRNYYKSLPESKENIDQIIGLQNLINQKLFVPHLISIKTDTTKKDYKYICKKFVNITFDVNGVVTTYTYRRLCAGAGQLRRNTALFVNTEIYDELEYHMMCGLTKKKIGKMNLSKFNAYYALYTSASSKVRTPHICVIPDYEYPLKNQKVSWIFDNKNGEKDVEDRVIDFDMNAFDGSGMISPDMAEKWQEDLGLDYLPSSFILRSAWVKGLVSVFDFKKFAREVAHTDKIKDLWGNEYDIDTIDVVLTKSQFKMAKKYSSWQEYLYYHQKFGHIFGVARVNKRENDFVTTLNYQYVQSNNFNEERIKGLANFTVDWLKKIMTGDKLYTSLFMVGCQDEDSTLQEIEDGVDSYMAKSLIYSDEILKDDYVRSKINQMIEKKVRQAKIGKLFVEGSYDFAIPDLYAMAEHAFGMEVKGLLKAGESWNPRWVEKNSTTVAMFRSPLVAPAENQTRQISLDDRCKEWFSYIKSGMVMTAWDLGMILCSDADYDGDIVLSTDNKYVVDSIYHGYPITYEKSKTKEQKLNLNNFANIDVKSFDSKIGFITNLASSLIAMLSNFSADSKEYKEIKKRIDLLRYFQGSAIDATKGDVFIPPPKDWYKKKRYLQADSYEDIKRVEQENKKMQFENKICANRKPYFFGYVYPSKMKEFKKHKAIYNDLCWHNFGCSMKELQKKKDKTADEKKFLIQFNRYMPLMNNNCIMNTLSKYVEDVEFDNKWKKDAGFFDYHILMSGYELNNEKLKRDIHKLIKEFNYQMQVEKINLTALEDMGSEGDEDIETSFAYLFEFYEERFLSLCSDTAMLTDYVIDAYYTRFHNSTKTLLWNIFGEQIFKNIKSKSHCATFACRDENGLEYLGQCYKLKEVVL